MKPSLLLAILAICHGTAQALIVVSNDGTTTPTGFATGNTALDPHPTTVGSPEVFGFRLNNTHKQTFTLTGDGIELEKIHIGYGSLTGAATESAITLTVDAGNNGSNEISEQFTLTKVPPSITQQAAAPYAGLHWLELDVSSYALLLGPGTHSFQIKCDSITGAASTWLLAPTYTGTAGFVGDYTGGNMSGTAYAGLFPNRDTNFAVSGSVPDVDNDGLPDPWELSFAGITLLTDLNGTLPAGSGPGAGTGDYDGDGLSDLDESTESTNPTLPDTDTDGLTDLQEVDGLLNPYTGLVLGSLPGNPTEPLDSDSDNDGISDGQEVVAGTDGFITNPNQADTDADGMIDLYEGNNNLLGGLNPTNPSDGAAAQDLDSDGIDNIDEHNRTPQTRADKADTDADGYSDAVEDHFGTWANVTASGTNPVVADTDGDGLLDGTENPDLVTHNPPTQNKCDPNMFDTDGDFYSDGTEVAANSEPANAASVPTGVPIRGTDFSSTSGWTNKGGTTLQNTTELLSGSGQYARIDMAGFENGVVLPYPNPAATVYCSVDFRIDGTFGGSGTSLVNFNSGARNATSSDNTVHCIVRLHETDGSITAFNGSVYLSVVAAGGIVSGTTYTVQIDHNIPGETYAVRVYNRDTGTLIGSRTNVPTRPTSSPTADPLYFTAGVQAASANWDLAVDNMKVALASISVPVTAELRITGTSINLAGDFVIDFIGAPSTNYEVTKSLTLQAASFVPLGTPLIVTTAANGIGQAIVPAAEKTEPSAFFRMETP